MLLDYYFAFSFANLSLAAQEKLNTGAFNSSIFRFCKRRTVSKKVVLLRSQRGHCTVPEGVQKSTDIFGLLPKVDQAT